LVKTLPENIAILQVLGNCKVQAPGATKVTQSLKAKGKPKKAKK
jgi:hypothetical protein